MSKAIIFFGLFLFLCNKSTAQDNLLPDDTRSFILSHFEMGEDNPIHKQESDTISLLFQNALKNFNVKKHTQYNKLVQRVMRKIYDNASGSYEDSYDARRMMMRRSECFSTLALVSDDISVITYMDLALHSLSRIDNCEIIVEESMEEQYFSLLLLQIYIEYEYSSANNYAFNPDIKATRNYIVQYAKRLSPGFMTKANTLIDRWEKMK